MLNFFVMILCIMCAIWQGYNGNIGFLLVEVGCVLINLPFAIKWLVDFIND